MELLTMKVLLEKALAAHRKGKLSQAEQLYLQIIKQQPFEIALSNLASLYACTGREKQSLNYFKKAITINPQNERHYYNLGNTYFQLQSFKKAQQQFKNAIAKNPNYALAFHGLANTENALKNYQTAAELYQIAIRKNPKLDEAYNNLAMLEKNNGDFKSAENHYQKALSLSPNNHKILNNYGSMLLAKNEPEKALHIFKQAAEINHDAIVFNHIATAYKALNAPQLSIENYIQSLSIKPDFKEALYNLAHTYLEQKEHNNALLRLSELHKIDASFSPCSYLLLQAKLCEWQNIDKTFTALKNNIANAKNHSDIKPHALLTLIDNPKLQSRYSQKYFNHLPTAKPVFQHTQKQQSRPINIAYISADFKNHPLSHLLVEMFENHNQNDFVTYGFALCAENKQDEMQQRVKNAFDHFFFVGTLNEKQIAEHIYEKSIDIAVDLGGITKGAKPLIFAYRPAPIQIHYMGYPGPLNNPYIDYFVADKHVITEQNKKDFSEKIIYMPESYWVSDSKQKVAPFKDRSFYKLPENRFVFACFNRFEKITQKNFDLWLTILQQNPNSVLWLLNDNDIGKENLKNYAAQKGIASDRIIFAEKLPRDQHLARIQHADLILDTLACNGHTTTSDALSVGIPVLSLPGQSFASRVSFSMLNTLNLTEFICHDQNDYIEKSVMLSKNSEALQQLKNKLQEPERRAALFNTKTFTAHLENAYQKACALEGDIKDIYVLSK